MCEFTEPSYETSLNYDGNEFHSGEKNRIHVRSFRSTNNNSAFVARYRVIIERWNI